VITIGGIDGLGALGSFTGKNVDLVGDINLAGGITSLQLHGIRGGKVTTPKIGRMTVSTDFSDDVSVSTIGAFTASSISGGNWSIASGAGVVRILHNATVEFSAATLRSLFVGGSLANSTLDLTAPASPGLIALGSLVVRGGIAASVITAAGNIGTVASSSLLNSQVYAGVNDLGAHQTLPDSSIQLSTAIIKSIVIGTPHGSANNANSAIAAGSIGQLNLGGVQLSNGGIPFGVAAHAIGTVTGVDSGSGKHIALHKLSSGADTQTLLANEGITGGDLVVRLI
jgi:hypothetical protein